MRVKGNVSPVTLSMESYLPLEGYVEVRLRENIKKVTSNLDLGNIAFPFCSGFNQVYFGNGIWNLQSAALKITQASGLRPFPAIHHC